MGFKAALIHNLQYIMKMCHNMASQSETEYAYEYVYEHIYFLTIFDTVSFTNGILWKGIKDFN